jgi:hypothetical protein
MCSMDRIGSSTPRLSSPAASDATVPRRRPEASATESPSQPEAAGLGALGGSSVPGEPGIAAAYLDRTARGDAWAPSGPGRESRPTLGDAEPARALPHPAALRRPAAALLGAGLGMGAFGIGSAALGALGPLTAIGAIGAALAGAGLGLAAGSARRDAASPGSTRPARVPGDDEPRGRERRRGLHLEPDLRPLFEALRPVGPANERVLHVVERLVRLAQEAPDPRARDQLLHSAEALVKASDQITAALEEAAKV